MANKKIQIKNSAGDNLFPMVKKATIEDFSDSDYASANHTHTFTGTAKTIGVSGTYVKPVGISINSITPKGNVTLTRSANVALSTTSIQQITGVGTLPTKGAVTVVTGVSGGGGSRTLSYLHYTAPTATKGSYTPAGSVTLSRSTGVALSTSTISQITAVGTLPTRSSFTYNTVTVTGTTLSISSKTAYQITGVGTLPTKSGVSVATGVSTQPNFTGTFNGTATTSLVTAISGGTLTADATADDESIQVVSNASFTNASATTSTISQITNVGTLPTRGAVTVATGVSTQPNFTATFNGTSTSISGSVTTSNTSITLSGSYTPAGTIGSAN